MCSSIKMTTSDAATPSTIELRMEALFTVVTFHEMRLSLVLGSKLVQPLLACAFRRGQRPVRSPGWGTAGFLVGPGLKVLD